MSIRLALKQDESAVYELICQLENKKLDHSYFQSIYQNALNNAQIIFLVFEHEKEVLGFISLYIQQYLHHSCTTAEIVELVVNEKKRGLAIGSQLLAAAEKQAAARQVQEIQLSTSCIRVQAHHFYEKHGYQKDHFNYTKKL